MSRLPVLFLSVLAMLFVSMPSMAQTISFNNTRIGTVTNVRGTVGTTTALAIADASVLPAALAWSICNDAVNTSTFLYVGKAVDAATDGQMLGLGQCYVCPNCTPASLKLMRVKGQAAANGYTVVQYKQ